jgi:DNA-binding beta-propeller fold protein YncE
MNAIMRYYPGIFVFLSLAFPLSLFSQNAYFNRLNSVAVVNTAGQSFLTSIPITIIPDAVVVSPDGTRIYITSYADPNNYLVCTIDAASNTVLSNTSIGPTTGADGIDISPDGSKLYIPSIAAGSGFDTLFVLNTIDNSIIARIPLPSQGVCSGVAVNSNGTRVYVAAGNKIVVINAVSNTLINTNTISGAKYIYGLAINPAGSKVYAADFAGKTIYILNTLTDAVVPIATGAGSQPWAVAVHPNTSAAFVCDYAKSLLYEIDGTNDVITQSHLIGLHPYGVAITQDGSKVYTANGGSNYVYVTDVASNVADSINVGSVTYAVGKFIGPEPGRLCLNGSGILTANLTGINYQWQYSTDGTAFVNIDNGANYGGVNTRILQLKNIPAAWYGYQYKCVTDGVGGNISMISFSENWMAAEGTSWENNANWGCQSIPDSNTDVIINRGTVVINSDVTVRSLKVREGANVIVNTPFILTVLH